MTAAAWCLSVLPLADRDEPLVREDIHNIGTSDRVAGAEDMAVVTNPRPDPAAITKDKADRIVG